MELIHVPAPPKGAFNKNRRISDLIKSQIKHLKHIEYALPQEIRDTIPQHPVVTENDAALYIASMTPLLRSRAMAQESAKKPGVRKQRPIPIRSSGGLSLAAAAGQASKKSRSKKKADSKSTENSSPRKKSKSSSKRK